MMESSKEGVASKGEEGGREVRRRRGGVAEEDGGAVGVAMGGVGSAGSIPIQIGAGGGEWRRGEGG